MSLVYQRRLLPELSSIDQMKKYFSANEFWDEVKTAFAHQNCVMEGNDLTISESETISEVLSARIGPNYFDATLCDRVLPSADVVLPRSCRVSEKILEVRNAILAGGFFRNVLLKQPREADDADIRILHRILMKGLPMENSVAWGRVQRSGEYRTVVMQARGMPFTVYPVS